MKHQNGIITLENALASCKISIFGGHILSYRPKTESEDIFWMGNLNKFDGTSAIRGGVPVCWPRFAAEELNNALPRHGFARISKWQIESLSVQNDRMEAVLSLSESEKFNIPLAATLSLTITDHLECSLETLNTGHEPFCFGEALHAYFNISNRDDVILKGFAGHEYKNALTGTICKQTDDLKIKDEFDAAFLAHHSNISLIDKGLNRIITLEKTGSDTTVVWNPDKDLAEMTPGQYKNFICVEPANQGEFFVTLPPQQKHKISMAVRVKPLLTD